MASATGKPAESPTVGLSHRSASSAASTAASKHPPPAGSSGVPSESSANLSEGQAGAVVISLEDAEELASAGLVHVGGFLERKTPKLSNMSLLSPL